MMFGVDLGTTNSAMAHFTENGDAEIVQNSDRHDTTPSAVLVENDEAVVGRSARNSRVLNPERTLTRTKQDMGEDVEYDLNGKTYTPVQTAKNILEKLKIDAEERLGESVESAVITVPYYFGDKARVATKDAGEMAGLNVLEVLNEPEAACLAYRHDSDLEGTVLVYDLGGGTFDVTLAESRSRIKVIATEGDKDLGGENFDDALYEHVRQQLIDDGHPDPEDNKHKKASLRDDIVKMKHGLSTRNEYTFGFDTGDGIAEITMTREEFNEVVDDLVERTIAKTRALFEKDVVDITKDEIDHTLMVGGSTRIPLVRQRVEDFMGTEPRYDTDPDTVVARGAAIRAASYDEAIDVDMLPSGGISKIVSHSLGVETEDGSFDSIIDQYEEVPKKESEVYTNPEDNIKQVTIRILEGEGEMANDPDVEPLGEFQLKGIEPQPMGEARIDVTFDVTQEGILQVSAEDRDSDAEESITVEDTIGLSEEEKEQMRDDSPDYRPTPT